MKLIIQQKTMLYSFVVFLLLLPASLYYINVLHNYASLINILTAIGVIIYFFKNRIHRKIFKEYGFEFSLLFCFVQFLLVIYIQEGYASWIKNALVIIAFECLIYDNIIKSKTYIFNAICIIGIIYICLECFTCLGSNDFLNDFNEIYAIYPCIATLLLYMKHISSKKIYSFAFYIVTLKIIIFPILDNYILYGILNLEISFYLTALILIVYDKFPQILKKINFKIALGFMFFLNVTIVVTQTLLSTPIIQLILQKIFHKSINLTGRTDLWRAAIKLICQKPIEGYGVLWEGLPIWYGYYHPHNQFLYLVLVGGISIIIILLLWLFYVVIDLDKIKKRDNKRLIGFLGWGLIAQIFSFTTLSFNYRQIVLFFALLFLASNKKHLLNIR